MRPLTPLVFRPSFSQRAVAALLWVGSWLVGARSLAMLLEHLPRLQAQLRAAASAHEPSTLLWAQLVAVVLGALLGGLLLAASTVALLMVEGVQVAADELGIAVEVATVPAALARRLGAGRLSWKHVTALDRSGPFFVLRGQPRKPGDSGPEDPVLRFLMVEEMERLVLTVLERSPNLRFDEDAS